MLFTNTDFLILFLPLLFLCYFIIPQGKDGRLLWWKNFVLLAFSAVFYGFNGVRFLGLLGASIVINYVGGLTVTRPASKAWRRALFILVMVANFALLGYFKYANFATEVAANLGLSVRVTSIVLPVGISFFTFQGASYVIDVYRGDAAVQKNPLKVALYVALFPQLVAGPIVRYTTVERELNARRHTLELFSDGVERFMIGFAKKMILANAMGEIADQVFAADPSTTAVAWVGAIAYTFQIYFDFSAYSDMAIGLGKMFGFRFEENFNYPYIASSVTDFWRRWHISLSTWFRDYVYIPLGGNRCSKARHIFNLMVVWTLTGMWHGAAWTFILWGAYFGVLLIAEKYLLGKILPKIPAVIRHILVLLIVVISWVLFRSDTIGYAARYVGVMFGAGGNLFSGEAVYYLLQYLPEFVLCVIGCFPLGKLIKKRLSDGGTFPQIVYHAAPKLYAVVVFALGYMKLVSGSFNPFIYFRF